MPGPPDITEIPVPDPSLPTPATCREKVILSAVAAENQQVVVAD
jgi:hypothetical protein